MMKSEPIIFLGVGWYHFQGSCQSDDARNENSLQDDG